MTQHLSIIGFGQFGKLAAKHLAARFIISTYDKRDVTEEAHRLNTEVVTLEEAAKAEIILICVPAQALEETVRNLTPHLKPGTLVIDVCATKMLAAQHMLNHLPEHVDIIGTHPLFGPQSMAAGISLLKVAVCPLRISDERMECVRYFMEQRLALTPLITTPEEHDRHLAYVLSLTHLIGRALINIGVPASPFATHSYQQLLTLCDIMRPDTTELFHSLQHLNPHAPAITRAFIEEAERLLAAPPAE